MGDSRRTTHSVPRRHHGPFFSSSLVRVRSSATIASARGIEGSHARDVIFGFVASGSMCYDGIWKLARYSNGYAALFNTDEDPAEQHNRINDSACQEIRARLDALLNAQMLRSINRAHAEKNHNTDWVDPDFAAGAGCWQRVYPQPIH